MLGLKRYSWVYKAWQLADGKWHDHAVPGDPNSPVVEVQAPGRDSVQSASVTSAISHSSVSSVREITDGSSRYALSEELDSWGNNENSKIARSMINNAERTKSKIEVANDVSGKAVAVFSLTDSEDKDGKSVHLSHIAVRPDSENKGIAGYLLAKVGERALREGKTVTLIPTDEKENYYKRRGFVREENPSGRGRKFMRWEKDKIEEHFSRYKERNNPVDKDFDDSDELNGGYFLANPITDPVKLAADKRFLDYMEKVSKDKRLQIYLDLEKGVSEDEEVTRFMNIMKD